MAHVASDTPPLRSARAPFASGIALAASTLARASVTALRVAAYGAACTSAVSVTACGGAATQGTEESVMTRRDDGAERRAIGDVLDDWHAAAAASDEERYFGHLGADAIFLGTDATERWNPLEFRRYAHDSFAARRGWRMRSIRRSVTLRGDVAWFDEDLETANLGPSRGSGVLERGADGRWRIAQYNLAITVPNERFREVRTLLQDAGPASDATVASPSD